MKNVIKWSKPAYDNALPNTEENEKELSGYQHKLFEKNIGLVKQKLTLYSKGLCMLNKIIRSIKLITFVY